MARLILAVAILALIVAAAWLGGELHGERRQRQRTAADVLVLTSELHTQRAALMAIPGDDEPAVAHGRLVAAEHASRWQPAVDWLVSHLPLRRAA
ncbi:hypothetical protein [Micromonospora tarensis]|uniref:Uncharacterized protein n=1 Tax=Micromonospora tarensis TaxID=2806100 RepID=A0ABS1YIK1_9ACTN|nr:hypothetical protein [Micromonospora tarensis]MBM0277233.1 hypothetical protein [Micromonospora tarensis]